MTNPTDIIGKIDNPSKLKKSLNSIVSIPTGLSKAISLSKENNPDIKIAELELIQRVLEIRQNFSNVSDSDRLVEPILQRISKIKSEKLTFEQKFNLI